MQQLELGLKGRFWATDYLVFVCDEASFVGCFWELIEKSLVIGAEVGIQVIFLVIGAHQRPTFLATRAPPSPTFYLKTQFGEKDLEHFRAYLVQDSIGGYKQQ
ncbi:MAG: hypothetical protein K2X35_23520 [Bryobacteraceae bacterium]|nr:hypothetical protein [Bryobacteraceae bacterium]